MQRSSLPEVDAIPYPIIMRFKKFVRLVAVDTGQPVLHTHCQSHAQSM